MPGSTDHTSAATFTLGSDFPYAALAHPTSVGPYHIIEVVGEGGMGVVFKAEQREPVRRVVALKLIKLGMDTREVIARFESERQALAMMSHPNVAKVLDAGATEGGRPYFVMEFVAGEPITTYCDKHQLSVAQRLELFTQACTAVEHAHQKALIHRDIKPSNILVAIEDAKPVVKVIDFGVAKATNQRLTERTIFTERGQLIGTPEYMSPEQAEMSGATVDTRTDIYSLGVVLYELLCGALPFDAKSLRSAAFNEIQRIIREVDPPRPSTRVSTLGDNAADIAKRRQTQVESLSKQLKSELEWIPLKAMRKDPTHRYRTVSEFAADVQNYLAHRPLTAGPESVSYRARKFVRRNKGPVAAAAVVLAVLVAGVIGTTTGFVRAERQRRDAVAARDGSEAVNQFLTKDVIGSADPAVMRGRELTVREALGNAAGAIATKFANQPLTESSVRLSVALSYQSLGRADLGLPHAQAAVETRRRLLGDDHPDTLQARHVLGIMYLSQARWPDAAKEYDGVVAARTRVLGADHPLTLESRHNLACVYEGQGKLDQAARIFREVLDRRAGTLGPGDENTISTLGALALVLSGQGKLDDAENLYRDALARSRASHGDEHPQTLNVTLNYAALLHNKGRLEQAGALYAQSLPTFRRVLGDDHHTTQTLVNGYASVLHDLHKLDEAERLARDTLARARRTSIADHHNTLYALNNLATLLQERGRLDEAEPLFREALAGYRRSLGNDHGATLVLINNLAGVLHARGNPREAEPLFKECVDAQRRTFGAEHPDTLVLVSNHALVLHALGRSKEAEDILRPTLDASRRVLGEDHINSIGAVNALALVLKEQGRLDEAEPLYRQALAACRNKLGEEHPNTLLFKSNLAKLLQAKQNFADAEPLLREALAGLRKVSGDDHPNTLRTLQSLVALLMDQSRHADAEPLAAELYDRARRAQLPPRQFAVATAWYGPCLAKLGKIKEADAPLRDAYQRLTDTDQRAGTPMRFVLQGLADVCEKTNRADEAERWRAELRAAGNHATRDAVHDATRDAPIMTPPDDDNAATFTLGGDFPYPALAQPTDIGPYHLIEIVGQGGMGIVYKAEQREPVHRVVALKLIKLGMDTREVIARFESERQALAMMSHPNVAKVLDAGATESGRPYFVMEFVAGEPITAYCDKHQLTVRQRFELFAQACQAVEHAHQKALIHRDIKPGNVLVMLQDGAPVVKVIDFGVAKATNQRLTERTLFTERGQLIGTPEYMSPEQAEMGGTSVDTRTDIYSLGVVLYELLCGALPFDPKSLRSGAFNEIQRIIREVDPPRPSTRVSTHAANAAEIAKRRRMQVDSLSRQLRSELEWIPLKAMRKDPSQRYRTVGELSADVSNYLENRPLTAGPESVSYRARKFVRRNKGPVVAAALVLLVLIAGVVGTSLMYARAQRNLRLATSNLQLAERNEAKAQREASKAGAVNTFLQDMLRAVDPTRALTNREITVREALDKSAAKVDEGAFASQPEIESAVRGSLGKTYLALGLYPKAESHLRRALELRRAFAGEEDLEATRVMLNVGEALWRQGNPAEAEALARRALDVSRKLAGDDSEQVGAALNCVAWAVSMQGRYVEAETMLRESVRLQEKFDKPEELAAVKSNLAGTLMKLGRTDEAEKLYVECVALNRRAYGETHPYVTDAESELAWSYYARRRFADAERMYRRVLEARRAFLGNDHPDVALTLNSLAAAVRDQGRPDEAERMLLESLAMRRKSLGNDHPFNANTLNNLAGVAVMRRDFVAAERYFRDALEVRRKTQGADHPEFVNGEAMLGYVLVLQDKGADAEPFLRDAHAKLAGAPETDFRRHYVMCMLGGALAAQEKYAEAEPLLVGGYEGFARLPQMDDAKRREIGGWIVRMYESTHRPDKAAEWRAELPPAPTTAPPTAPAAATAPTSG